LQPQAPPQQPPPEDPEEGPLEDLLPFAGAAKTDSCMVFLALAHFGHVIFVFPFITMRS
jgi:hypothetical protein